MRGFIYVARYTTENNVYKIGRTYDIECRKRSYQKYIKIIEQWEVDDHLVAEQHIKYELRGYGIRQDARFGKEYYRYDGCNIIDVMNDIILPSFTEYYITSLTEHYKYTSTMPNKGTMNRYWLDSYIDRMKKHPGNNDRLSMFIGPLLRIYGCLDIAGDVKLPPNLYFMLVVISYCNKRFHDSLWGETSHEEYDKNKKVFIEKLRKDNEAKSLPKWKKRWFDAYDLGWNGTWEDISYSIAREIVDDQNNPYGLWCLHIQCYEYYELNSRDHLTSDAISIIEANTYPAPLTTKQKNFFKRLRDTLRYNSEKDIKWLKRRVKAKHNYPWETSATKEVAGYLGVL